MCTCRIAWGGTPAASTVAAINRLNDILGKRLTMTCYAYVKTAELRTFAHLVKTEPL